MAMGKHSRVDGKKSWSYFSTTSIVVFVTFSLAGVWMLIPSIIPQSSEITSVVNEAKHSRKDNRNLEARLGDVLEGETKGGSNANKVQNESDYDKQDDQKIGENESWTSKENQEEKDLREGSDEKTESEKKSQSAGEENQPDHSVKESSDGNSESTNEAKLEVENNEDGKKEDDGSKSENGESFFDDSKPMDGEESKGEQTEQDKKSSETLSETTCQNKTWLTQAEQSQDEKELQQSSSSDNHIENKWKLCNSTAGPDYIPCLDNWLVIRKLPSTSHYEHRERHCPAPSEAPTCLVPLPKGYRPPIKWPESKDRIWYSNVPYTKLVEVKGHQNWVKVAGEYLTFPGGGTQFKNGALHYIDLMQKSLSKIAWGKRTRVALDVGCGVASFGGYLLDRDVLTMSLAPKDEHEAQVQFALERGIPAILGVMGTKRLPFPGSVFDLVHCARCRVPWHIEGGKLLLELNRVLRPGGYFIWSATPVYQKLPEDVGIWKAMSRLTKSMCWDVLVIKKDRLNGVAAAIYRKPTSNDCYSQRSVNEPPLCAESDDPNAAWNVSLQACMHKVPVKASERGSRWPEQWPLRLETPPRWLKSRVGVYGKPAPEDFTSDYEDWKNIFFKSYLNGMGISWSSVRNVMDMRAVYGGFAAVLRDMKVWVMNVVLIGAPDTLPIIYERGLIGTYHDWCESFNTYPRSYDLLHADHLFFSLKKRCKIDAVIAEVDRILRPEGKLIVRDEAETIGELESIARSLQWKIHLVYSKDGDGLLYVEKTFWRPITIETITSAII